VILPVQVFEVPVEAPVTDNLFKLAPEVTHPLKSPVTATESPNAVEMLPKLNDTVTVEGATVGAAVGAGAIVGTGVAITVTGAAVGAGVETVVAKDAGTPATTTPFVMLTVELPLIL